jgi:hypothetical protein
VTSTRRRLFRLDAGVGSSDPEQSPRDTPLPSPFSPAPLPSVAPSTACCSRWLQQRCCKACGTREGIWLRLWWKRPLRPTQVRQPLPPLAHPNKPHQSTRPPSLPHPHAFQPLTHAAGCKGRRGGNICPTRRGSTSQQHKHQQKGFSAPSPPLHTPAHPPPP